MVSDIVGWVEQMEGLFAVPNCGMKEKEHQMVFLVYVISFCSDLVLNPPKET